MSSSLSVIREGSSAPSTNPPQVICPVTRPLREHNAPHERIVPLAHQAKLWRECYTVLRWALGSRVISITNVSPVLNFRRIRGTEPVLWISSISSPTRGYCSLYIAKALATINAARSGVFTCSPICPPLLRLQTTHMCTIMAPSKVWCILKGYLAQRWRPYEAVVFIHRD